MRIPVGVLLSVLAGMLACGLPLWPIPYSKVSMPGNPSPAVWLCLGVLAGVIAANLIPRGFRAPLLSVTAGFVLAVIVRVAWETNVDPTSHNLWPFEVVIAGFFGVVSGAIGVGVSRAARRLLASR